MKIDHRHHYLLVLDTETTNSLMDNLFYDLGFKVIDTKGRTYERHSFVNADIFCDEQNLMQSAYYKEKIPNYWKDIKNGSRKLATTYTIRKTLFEVIAKYNITEISAHNARFDYRALNLTYRWVTKSKYRFFLPYEIIMWDTLKMAREIILPMPSYQKFCKKHNLFTPTGRLSATAENLYRFISKNANFIESHTGLEDVEIESEILIYCLKKGVKNKKLFEKNS